ncbi:MAG: NTP transferase domain-containing protein [Gemmatimonadota bacterium]|nr:NTP transferase domain-containing protein [Gemmatimonadota bacterium]
MSLPLVVLAAGLSTRFGRLKQLERLGPSGEAIMDYNVFDALRAGFDEVTYVVRPQILEDVKAHVADVFGDSVHARFVLQDLASLPPGFRSPPDRRRPWGTAHAVLCAAEGVQGPMAVCNADDLYGPAAFKQLYDYLTGDVPPSDAALIAYPLRDTLAGGGGVARGLCHVGRNGMLEHVIEVREIRRSDAWIVGIEGEDAPIDLTGDELVSMNLWGLKPSMIEGIRNQFRRFLDLWGAHADREFFLSTAVNEHIQTYESRVHVLDSEDSWLGITYAEDRERFQSMLEHRIKAGAYPKNLTHGFVEKG